MLKILEDLCCSAVKRTPSTRITACEFIPGQSHGDLLQTCKDSEFTEHFCSESGHALMERVPEQATIPAYTLLIHK
jgi:hypothetical protein